MPPLRTIVEIDVFNEEITLRGRVTERERAKDEAVAYIFSEAVRLVSSSKSRHVIVGWQPQHTSLTKLDLRRDLDKKLAPLFEAEHGLEVLNFGVGSEFVWLVLGPIPKWRPRGGVKQRCSCALQ